jgi:alanyl-tRNA synthetase
MSATERLYYDDSELLAFSAQISALREQDGRCWAALTRSAFYPEGGGQPADHGTLDGETVDDVQVDDDGIVWHRLAGTAALPTIGGTVHGRIDAERRWDHMQQHCGQHIMTAAFLATGGPATVSFHLSGQSVTIDLAAATISDEQLHAAETWANAQIRANVPIEARFVSAAELARIPLRKAPSVTGPVRVVSIGDIDHSACGGTHPTRSGAVGMLAVLGWEKQRGAVRVSFACGTRLLQLFRQQRARLAAVAGLLQIGTDEAPTAVERLLERQRQLQEDLHGNEREYDRLLAEQLSRQAGGIGDRRLVTAAVERYPAARLRRLAQLIAEQSGAAVILTTDDGAQQRIVIVGSSDGQINARGIMQRYLAVSGGRGGGSAQLAEGGGPAANGTAALQAALDSIVETGQ